MNRYTIRGYKYGDTECPMSKLQDLENKIEDGVLVELPCKLGSTVYAFVNWCDYTDCHFEGCAGCSHCNDKGIVERCFNYSHIKQIGKTVFLTREEAEKALTERKEQTDGKAD